MVSNMNPCSSCSSIAYDIYSCICGTYYECTNVMTSLGLVPPYPTLHLLGLTIYIVLGLWLHNPWMNINQEPPNRVTGIMETPSPTFSTGTRLKDKVCIITGSSSGLGRAIALAFAAQGARLVVCADLNRNPRSDFMAEEAGISTDEAICRRHGNNAAIFFKTNVTIGTEVQALVQAAVRTGGRLDV